MGERRNDKIKARLFAVTMITLFLASVLSMAFVAPVAATSGGSLVGLWHFDEGTGSTASDSSGNLNHGTLSGGKFGNALYFDGVGDYVEVLSDSSIAPPSITVEAWVKGTGPLGIYKYIISKYYIAAPGGYSSYAFYTGSTGGLYFYVGTNTGYKISGNAGTSIWDGNWHHIAGTYDDSTEVLQFYVDGQRITNIDYGTNLNIVYDNGNLYFGNYRPVWLPYDSFKGYIDEVRISNTIKYTVASFTPPSSAFTEESDTLGLWHFDESVGTTAYDSSDNHNDGAIFDAKWAGPTWVQGRTGDVGDFALNFDGVDDFVSIADSASLDAMTDFTIDFWLKPAVTYSAGAPDFYVFLSKYGVYSFQFVYHPSGYLYLWVSNGMAAYSEPVTLNAETWYHLAATFDSGTSDSHIYVNGIDVTESTTTQTMTVNDSPLLIGARPSPSPPYPKHFLNGVIDEVSIWNVVLPFHLQFLETSTPIVAVNNPATLIASLTDDNGQPVEGVDVTFSSDAPSGVPLSFDSNVVSTGSDGYATVHATGTAASVYTVTASAATPFGSVSATWTLVVYDPSAGFVTGGGWINSPAGAYKPDETLAGKATFGFVSKYQKGAAVPTGQTQFVFHAVGMNFHSVSYEWLVVAGTTAQYKGTGTINGLGDYKFILWAGDGGSTGDTFRIKIWDATSEEEVIYDNGMLQAISGGSIVIHK